MHTCLVKVLSCTGRKTAYLCFSSITEIQHLATIGTYSLSIAVDITVVHHCSRRVHGTGSTQPLLCVRLIRRCLVVFGQWRNYTGRQYLFSCFPAGRLCRRISLLLDYQEFMVSRVCVFFFYKSKFKPLREGYGVTCGRHPWPSRSGCARLRNIALRSTRRPRTNRFGFRSCWLILCCLFNV